MTKQLSQSFKFVRHMSMVALGILGFLTIAPMPGWAEAYTNIDGVYMASATQQCPSLTTGGFCTATFPALPKKTNLIVDNVSCLIETISSAIPFVLTLGGGSQDTFLANGTGVLFDGTAYYQSTFSVLSVYASSQTPTVVATPLASSANMSMSCTIAGHLSSS